MATKEPVYSVIDVETTGLNPKRDRIVEIAIYRFDGKEVTEKFNSLVNPLRPISREASAVNGIDQSLVEDAPQFYEIAKQIVEITEGSIFVAHNVRFDYSFIQKEFRSLGYTFSRKQLCTAKLSKKLVPNLNSYSLKHLCHHFDIVNQAPHRAWGDTEATVELLRKLLAIQAGEDTGISLRQAMTGVKLPPNLNWDDLDRLPDATGVYYFHDAEGRVLYTGKSKSIRKRVMSHFQGAYNKARTIEMILQIHSLSFEVTGSELVALLLENEEIKRLQPPYNRAQRRTHFKHAVYAHPNAAGYMRLFPGKINEKADPVALFTTRAQAEGAIKRLVNELELCPKLCGVEPGTGRCFYHQLHRCYGACIGDEEVESYNSRIDAAIQALSYGEVDDKSYLVIGKGRLDSECSVVFVEKGAYRGFGFFEKSFLEQDLTELIQAIPQRLELPDVKRIVYQYIRNNPREVREV